MATKTQRTRFTPRLISLAVASCFATGAAYAQLPTGAHSTTGVSSINTVGNTMTVITNANRSIANWQAFSIGSNSAVIMQQPGVSSAMLNRVTGGDPSAIMGTLQSNGRVFLINPAGIVFGASAQVDVAGLVASTLRLSDTDFLANRLRFTDGAGAGSVINDARPTQANPNAGISAREGGEVYLVGKNVTNNGVITTPKGEVVLAAGNWVELVNPGTPNLRVEVRAPNNEARNLGDIVAEAGRVGIYAGLIHQGATGAIRADSAVAEGGRIVLKATKNTTIEAGSIISASGASGGQVTIQSGDTTVVSGAVSATGSTGEGGTVQVLGNLVGLMDNASIDVSGETGGGTALVGGGFQGKNPNVQNAYSTYFGPNAKINADAIGNGNGGTVVVWSDNTTGAYGTISARGGKDSGDGGFVEVSSRGWLDFHANVDTTAPKGRTGTLLLDPVNVCIYASDSSLCPGGGEGGASGGFTSGGSPSIWTNTGTGESELQWGSASGGTGSIYSNLQNNHVIVTTSGGSGGAGDINIVEGSPDLDSPHNLLLVAHRNVNVDGRIWNTGDGDLRVYAGWDSLSTPVTSLAAASQAAYGSAAAKVAVTPGVGDINVNHDIDMRGNVWLEAGNNITVNDSTIEVNTSSSRAISLLAGNNITVNDSTIEVNTSSGGAISLLAGNNITVNDSTIEVDTSSSGAISLVAGNRITVTDSQVRVDVSGGEGSAANVVFSAGENIRVQNSTIGAEGGRGGLSQIRMAANGEISVGDFSIIGALASGNTASGTGGESLVWMTGGSVRIDEFSSVAAQGGHGNTAGGKGSVILEALAGSLTIDGAEGIGARGGNSSNTGGDGVVTLFATGPVLINNTNAPSQMQTLQVAGLGIVAAGGFGSAAGGNASTSITGQSITQTTSHVAAVGGTGGDASGSAVVRMTATGGDIIITGSGPAREAPPESSFPGEIPLDGTVVAKGGFGQNGGSIAGGAEVVLDATGQIRITNEGVAAIGGAGEARGGDAALKLGTPERSAKGIFITDSHVYSEGGFSDSQGGKAVTTFRSDGNIEVRGTPGLAATVLARGGRVFFEDGLPGAGRIVFVVAGQNKVIIDNDSVKAFGGARGSGSAFSSDAGILLEFLNRGSSGFSVNGTDDVVSTGNFGFFVNGKPAVLDSNFFVSYGGSLLPPEVRQAAEGQLLSSLKEIAKDVIPQKEEKDQTKEEKDQKKKEREC